MRPTVSDLAREARIGTVSLIVTAPFLAAVVLSVGPVGDPQTFTSGWLLGLVTTPLYLLIDRLVDHVLVSRGLVRPRRGGDQA